MAVPENLEPHFGIFYRSIEISDLWWCWYEPAYTHEEFWCNFVRSQRTENYSNRNLRDLQKVLGQYVIGEYDLILVLADMESFPADFLHKLKIEKSSKECIYTDFICRLRASGKSGCLYSDHVHLGDSYTEKSTKVLLLCIVRNYKYDIRIRKPKRVTDWESLTVNTNCGSASDYVCRYISHLSRRNKDTESYQCKGSSLQKCDLIKINRLLVSSEKPSPLPEENVSVSSRKKVTVSHKRIGRSKQMVIKCKDSSSLPFVDIIVSLLKLFFLLIKMNFDALQVPESVTEIKKCPLIVDEKPFGGPSQVATKDETIDLQDKSLSTTESDLYLDDISLGEKLLQPPDVIDTVGRAYYFVDKCDEGIAHDYLIHDVETQKNIGDGRIEEPREDISNKKTWSLKSTDQSLPEPRSSFTFKKSPTVRLRSIEKCSTEKYLILLPKEMVQSDDQRDFLRVFRKQALSTRRYLSRKMDRETEQVTDNPKERSCCPSPKPLRDPSLLKEKSMPCFSPVCASKPWSVLKSVHNFLDFSRGTGLNHFQWFENTFPHDIYLYPVERGRHPPSIMNYEVFRLGSFNYSEFPESRTVWVTQLAQSGFYFVDAGRRICCFSCGQECPNSDSASPEEGVHHHTCRRMETNRPLSVWTEGLNQEDLSAYFRWYGTLIPFHSEHREEPDISHQQSSGYASGSGQYATGEEETHDASAVDRVDSNDDSEMSVAAGPMRGRSNSLPRDLNDLSGGIVNQESTEPPRQWQVLTSATRNPMAMASIAIQGTSNAARNDINEPEGGAVGGAQLQPTFDLRHASYPQYATAQARMQTFAGWSVQHSHRPEDLVASGFFYAGYADCARCFYCGLGLKFWRPDDIPAYQHARFRPQCVYNRILKGQDYIDRVQEDVRVEQANAGNIAQQVEPALPAAAAPAGDIAEAGDALPGNEELPEMNSEMALAALEDGWSRAAVARAINHIINEFGRENLVRDILDDVLTQFGVEDLGEEEPNDGIEGPQGAFENRQNVGLGALDQITAQPAAIAPDEAEQAQAPLVQQPAPPELDPQEELQVAERENRYLSQRMTCLICSIRPVSCVYLPCGHVIACQHCADDASRCMLCEKRIVGTANIFLA